MSIPSLVSSSFPHPEPDIPKKVSQTSSHKNFPPGLESPSNNFSADQSHQQISKQSPNIATYHSQMQKLPETRPDRIVQLQKLIDDGTYSVPAQKLADKLIREL